MSFSICGNWHSDESGFAMSTESMNTESLRLLFVIRPHEIDQVASLIRDWREAFAQVFQEQEPGVCVWVTGENPPDFSLEGVCSHALSLPPVLDGYARSPLTKILWTPWGQKSGPNFQFFEILRRMHSSHRPEWVLQLESDTVPLRRVVSDDIPWVLERSDQWVVGSSASHADNGTLSSTTKQHINGAAFYRVGDSGFVEFLSTTWVQSLLYLLKSRPALAYDVLSSPQLWRTLPPFLAQSWEENRDKFMVTSNMVNLSSRKLPTLDPEEQLNSVSVNLDGQSSPWLLHLAKHPQN